MTTEEIFEKLQALQDVLVEKNRLENEVEQRPKQLAAQEELLTRLKKEWIEKDQEYVSAKMLEGERKNQLFEAQRNRERAEKNMDAVTTQREYENLDREIKDANEKETLYRKEIKQIDQRLADLNEDMRQKKELMEQQEIELASGKARVESEILERKKILDELEIKEKRITEGMDEELIFKFKRIIKKRAQGGVVSSKNGGGIVSIKGGVCSSCHMILPAQFANAVRSGKKIVSCPYCSSILYYEESEDGEENYFDDDSAGSLTDLEDLDDEEFDEEEEEEEASVDYEE